MRYIIVLLSCLTFLYGQSQDLLCTVQVRSDNVQATNKQIFTDLENAITQFLNQRKWISDKVQPQEKINCNIVINVRDFNIDRFTCDANISSSRPVFGTTYNTPIFTHFDQDCDFQYAQFQSLEYQEGANINPLTTILAYYANLVIGLDFDTFYPEGGTTYFNKALQIRNVAQNTPGWNPGDGRGNRNRYYLIDNLLDDRYRAVRAASYQYHRKGLDVFKDDAEAARKEIFASLEKIRTVQENLPNSVVFKVYFNAKREEIISIFKEANPGLKNRAVTLLGLLDPSNVQKYDAIKK